MTQPDFCKLCAELVNELHGYKVSNPNHATELIDRARAALATPPPAPPTIDGAEDAAKAIYSDAMTWTAANANGGAIPSWVEGGNSTAQDVARQVARSLIAPPPEPPTDDTKKALTSALNTLEGWDNFGSWVWPVSAIEQAIKNTTESLQLLRAALATPPPEPPTDEELLAMRSWSSHSHTFDSDLVDFARAALERWGR